MCNSEHKTNWAYQDHRNLLGTVMQILVILLLAWDVEETAVLGTLLGHPQARMACRIVCN
jgi:hypothetical protein